MRRTRALPLLLLVLGVAAIYFAAHEKPNAAKPRTASVSKPAPTVVPQQDAFVPAAMRARSISGRVQTESGAAIAGARICIADARAGCCAAPVCAESDAAGAFALAVESETIPTLFASHADYLPLTASALELSRPGPLVLTMKAGAARITGRVLDAAGGAIPGALLRVSDLDDHPLAIGIADANGAFRLNVAAGISRVAASADGYSEELRTVEAPCADLELRLAAASALSGHVVAASDRAPVGDVLVSARSESGTTIAERITRTLADGSFRLPGLRAGRYSVSAAAPHWRSETRWVDLDVADVSTSVELVVRSATQLSCSVRLGGSACTDGSVALQGPVSSAAALGSDGRVEFDGLTPGRYELDIVCEGARAHELLDIGARDEDRVWDLDPGARVVGVVRSARGTPVARAAIRISPVASAEERTGGSSVTNEDGEFSCAGLVPGDYDVELLASPSRADATRVRLSAGGETRVALQVHDEGAIHVRVESAQSFDRRTFSVIARKSDGALLQGQLRGDGFIFDPVPLGSYEVFSDADPSGATERADLTRDGDVVEVSLHAPELHSLRGRAVDEAGQGVPEAWVHAVREQHAAFAVATEPLLTDSEGRFALNDLTAGRYTLEVRARGAEGRALGVPSDASDAVVRLQRQGTVSGTLRNAAGDMIDAFIVAFSRQDGDAQGEVSGAQGSWFLPALAAGTYELTARCAEGSTSRIVTVNAGANASVAIELDPARTPLPELSPAEALAVRAELLPGAESVPASGESSPAPAAESTP